MKKIVIALLAGITCGITAAEPIPIISLPLNEGDFKAVKNIGSAQNIKVKFLNSEYAQWVDGPDGKAVRLKKSDVHNRRAAVVLSQINTVFNAGAPFSITMKIKTPQEIIRNKRYVFMQYSDSDSWGPGFRIGMAYHRFYFSLGNNERKGAVPGIGTNIARFSVKPDTWYDLACTYDGSNVKVYVDGILQAEGKYSCYQPLRKKDMFIGASTGFGTGYSFEGIISALKIYTVVLSDSDIAALCEGE